MGQAFLGWVFWGSLLPVFFNHSGKRGWHREKEAFFETGQASAANYFQLLLIV